MFKPLGLLLAACVSACATVEAPEKIIVPSPTQVVPAQLAPSVQPKPVLKRKIAIGRFSNSTRYGKSLLLPGERDPIADQAADMLMARLIETGKFIVVERQDLDVVNVGAGLVGVDAVIVGSVTEFGRKTEGQVGFLSATKKQTAQATVEARLVDAKTGIAFFSAAGGGEASTEAGEVAGFGARADYDATLNDRAISTAISDLTNMLVQNLEARRWSTDILQIRGDQVFLSGGARQGVRIGDRLSVERRGETVKSGQTGVQITLPGEKIGTLEVVSFFGDSELDEGAIARWVSGGASQADAKLVVFYLGSAQ